MVMHKQADCISPFGFLLQSREADQAEIQHCLLQKAWMRLAVLYARQAVGRTFPNPPVGCVVVQDGGCVGVGYTKPAGQSHAEIVALTQAAGHTKNADLYVTLEPCAHVGRTSPCVEAIVEAQIGRVFFLTLDPNPLVHGLGIQKLQEAGIQTIQWQGDAIREGLVRIAPFQKTLQQKKPFVIIKVATSLDGRTALQNGKPYRLSGRESLQIAHRLRNRVDAVLVGGRTVMADNPQLTVRDVTDFDIRNPIRVVLDTRLETSLRQRLYVEHPHLTWVAHGNNASLKQQDAFLQAGISLLPIREVGGRLDLTHLLEVLCARGLQSVMVESGGDLLTSLVEQNMLDELWWVVTPHLLGEPGPLAIRLNRRNPLLNKSQSHVSVLGKDCLWILNQTR